jgi:hypothetical protein
MKRSIAIHQQPTGGVRPNARQNDQINSSTTIPTTPGTGSRPQLASILREGRKSANIHLSSGVIWGIPDEMTAHFKSFIMCYVGILGLFVILRQ